MLNINAFSSLNSNLWWLHFFYIKYSTGKDLFKFVGANSISVKTPQRIQWT